MAVACASDRDFTWTATLSFARFLLTKKAPAPPAAARMTRAMTMMISAALLFSSAVAVGVTVFAAVTEATDTPVLARAELMKLLSPRFAAMLAAYFVFTVVTNLVEYVGVVAETELTAGMVTCHGLASAMGVADVLTGPARHACTRVPKHIVNVLVVYIHLPGQ